MTSTHQHTPTDRGGIIETTMHAIVQDKYGETTDVLRLEEISRPDIGDDDVLVRVQAASVHIGDWHVMTGLPYLLRIVGFGFRAPKIRVRGMDVAGTVEAVGKNVTAFHAGDEVFGTCDGSFAEYASTPQGTSRPSLRTSPSSRRRPYRHQVSQHFRRYATLAALGQTSRC
jgi:NADPH:quinone reductase-like Zn-dependent oxidoreductase